MTEVQGDARDALLHRWHRQHREQLAGAIAGPWHAELSELVEFLQSMTIEDGDKLINLVRSQGWHAANQNLRYLILHEIDLTIIRVRTVNKLVPFDDGLPGEPPTVFRIIREYLLFGDDGEAAPSPPRSCGTN
jgi:hypothetical protein